MRDANSGANQSEAWLGKKRKEGKNRVDFLIFSSDIFIERVSPQPSAPLRPLPESLREITVGFFFFFVEGGGTEGARQPAGVH